MHLKKLGLAWPRCLEKVPKIFSQMVVQNGDESHGIESVKNHQLNKSQHIIPHCQWLPGDPFFSPKLQITPFVTMLSYVDLWWSASPSPWEWKEAEKERQNLKSWETQDGPQNTRLINGVKWCLFLMAENKWVSLG